MADAFQAYRYYKQYGNITEYPDADILSRPALYRGYVWLIATACGVDSIRFLADWVNRYYLAYIVALLPFYIVNGILTSVPIVLYNNAENLGKRVGTIPFEDHFYLMALLLMNIGFFEYFKQQRLSR